MKKFTLLMLFVCLGYSAMAQIEFGLQVSPSIAGNRFIADDRYNFDNSNNLRLSVGVIADYFFAQNYAFGTGLIYRTKGGEVKYSYTPSNTNDVISGNDDISIRYIELPLTLKLFTNEISPGTILFFRVGGSLNTKVGAKVNGENFVDGEKAMKRFKIFEADALIGGGAEVQLGQSTKFFAGLTYHHGLSNIDKYYRDRLGNDDISLKNGNVSLDFGIKF